MIHKLYILTFLILLSGEAFGQDTINNLKEFSQPILKKHIGTPTVVQNTYELNRQEKDSIWLSVIESEKTQALLNDWKHSQNTAIFQSENLLQLFAILNCNTSPIKTKQNLLIGKIEYDKTQVKDGDDPYYVFPRGGFIEGPKVEIYSSKADAVQHFIEAHSKTNSNLFLIPRTIFVGVDLKKGKQQVRIDNKDDITLKKTLNFIGKIEISNVELIIPSPAAIFGGKAGLTIYYLKK